MFERDCAEEGCIVSAIANYTQRVRSPELGADQVADALRFLVHFVGDITMPLHNEALELGGNRIDVVFDGDDTNLHAIWDTKIPEAYEGKMSDGLARNWAQSLTEAIESGRYAAEKEGWVEGLDVENALSSALEWVRVFRMASQHGRH